MHNSINPIKEEKLKNTNRTQYFEKLVKIPFEMPPTPAANLKKFDNESLQKIIKSFQTRKSINGVRITKYNYAIGENDCCDGFMRLSNDEKSLIISKELKIKSKDQSENIMDDPEVFTTKLVKSNSSCKIADIQGFVYGGSTSRFWMYRKQIVSACQA